MSIFINYGILTFICMLNPAVLLLLFDYSLMVFMVIMYWFWSNKFLFYFFFLPFLHSLYSLYCLNMAKWEAWVCKEGENGLSSISQQIE